MARQTTPNRPIKLIAKEIVANWEKPDYRANPYLEAMLDLDTITDKYYLDDADDIIMRFLTNAGTWRGETARRIKLELNQMLNNK
jgi:hypothetical protein